MQYGKCVVCLSCNQKQNDMKTTIKVTNEEKFNALLYDVDTSELSAINNGMCEGNLLITHHDSVNEEWEGEHGVKEYEADFGFILISNEEK